MGGLTVDNQGAVIKQRIVVQGNATFESSSGGAPESSQGLTSAELAAYRSAVRARYGVTHFLGFSTAIEHGIERRG